MKISKNLKKAFADYIDAGWYILRSSNHLIWAHENGGRVTTAKTPSDFRSLKNAIKHFERESIKYNIAW